MKRLLLLPVLALAAFGLASCDNPAHYPELIQGPGCQWEIANPPEAWHHDEDWLQVDDIDAHADYASPSFPDEDIDINGPGSQVHAPSDFPFLAFLGEHPGTYTFDLFVTWRDDGPAGTQHSPLHLTIPDTC